MLKTVNPLVIICGNCGTENGVEQVNVSVTDRPTIKLPVCPNCGAQEFLFVLTVADNPGEHASLVRELAANLGLIQRADPTYFPK